MRTFEHVKRILSISLAILLLASSLGLTFATHYCGGHAMESTLALGHVNLDCGMGMDHSDSMNGNVIKNNDCCENQYISVEVDDQFNSSIQKISFESKFVVTLAYTLINRPVFEKAKKATFSDYSPPPLIPNLQVEYQTFLL